MLLPFQLTLIKTLILWALASSDAVQAVIKDSYKQARHDDDLNQPLSVQAWGQDGDKRRYWLVEGQDDTNFRLYRESNIKLKNNTWWSVAGNIEELKRVGEQLKEEGSQAARRLSERINLAIPRFEATEEVRLGLCYLTQNGEVVYLRDIPKKRRRREYRLVQKARFQKPDPGFSLYEGRTRGKKIRYTFSSDEDEESDAPSNNRRSTRHSGISTPAEPEGPTFTASGRQVKSRHGGAYGETRLSGQGATASANAMTYSSDHGPTADPTNGRPRRSALRQELTNRGGGGDHIEGYNSIDEIEDEEDAASSGVDDYAGDDDVEMGDENGDGDGDEDMSEDDAVVRKRESPDPSLVVQLRYQKKPPVSSTAASNSNGAQPNPSISVDAAARSIQDTAVKPSGAGVSLHVEGMERASNDLPSKPAQAPCNLPVRKPSITNFFKPVSDAPLVSADTAAPTVRSPPALGPASVAAPQHS